MDRREQVQYLNQALLAEMPQYREQAESFPADEISQRRLLRSLMNVRPPMPLAPEFLEVQDALLSTEREEKGVVDGDALPPTAGDPRLILWQRTSRLRADAIVDADNSACWCFAPCHGCIDNASHSAGGLQLRDACADILRAQGHPEPAGRATLTRAYNLPARYVLHTVGPIVGRWVSWKDRRELASCYRSCLELAAEHDLRSVAFCCISTGEFHFPNQEAAEIAVRTVREFLEQQTTSVERVIFNFSKTWTQPSTAVSSDPIEQLKGALASADAVVVRAGRVVRLCGMTYSGERFRRYFSDFQSGTTSGHVLRRILSL
ncbi:MAG: protein-ADP-ribose hydrolase [Dysosmobacter welbionis]